MGLPRYNNLPSYRNYNKSRREYWREVLDLELITEGFVVGNKKDGYVMVLERAETNESIFISKDKFGRVRYSQSHVGAFRRNLNKEVKRSNPGELKETRVASTFFKSYL